MFFGDYYVVNVEYDPETNLTKRIQICDGRCDHLGPAYWISREEAFAVIEDCYTLELPLQENQRVIQRQLVRVVELNGKKYLRTDGAAIASDYLGL